MLGGLFGREVARNDNKKSLEPESVNTSKLKRVDSSVDIDINSMVDAPSIIDSKEQISKLKKKDVAGISMDLGGDIDDIYKVASWANKISHLKYLGVVGPLKNTLNVVTCASKVIKSTYSMVRVLANGWYVPKHRAKYLQMKEFKKNFMKQVDKEWHFDELRSRKELLDRKKVLKEELEQLRIRRDKRIMLGKGIIPTVDIDKKQKELDHLEEYITIRNLEDINKERVKNDIFGITVAATGLGLMAVAYLNPVAGGLMTAASVIGYGSYILKVLRAKQKVGNKIVNFLAGRVKKRKGKEIISKAQAIRNIEVDVDVIKTSRLSGEAFSNKDYDILKELSGGDSYRKVSRILQNMGEQFIKVKEFSKVVEFLDEIKNSDVNKLSQETDKERARVLIDDLETRVKEYGKLLDTSGYKTMRLYNDIYNAKIGLQDVENAKVDNWWENGSLAKKGWTVSLLKKTNWLNAILVSKSKQVFNKFDDNKGISRFYKDNIVSDTNETTGSLMKWFAQRERTERKNNEITANYIINIIKKLPERKELIRDGKEIGLDDLNLDNANDRKLLNEVYETTMQYEHVKKFLSACKLNKEGKKVNKLIDKIRKEEDLNEIMKIRDELVKDMTKISV